MATAKLFELNGTLSVIELATADIDVLSDQTVILRWDSASNLVLLEDASQGKVPCKVGDLSVVEAALISPRTVFSVGDRRYIWLPSGDVYVQASGLTKTSPMRLTDLMRQLIASKAIIFACLGFFVPFSFVYAMSYMVSNDTTQQDVSPFLSLLSEALPMESLKETVTVSQVPVVEQNSAISVTKLDQGGVAKEDQAAKAKPKVRSKNNRLSAEEVEKANQRFQEYRLEARFSPANARRNMRRLYAELPQSSTLASSIRDWLQHNGG